MDLQSRRRSARGAELITAESQVSILVASVAGDGSLWRLLDSLPGDVEVIVADRTAQPDPGPRYPDCQFLRVAPGTGIPQMRAEALQAASGSIVVVLEDHCVVPPGWLDQLTQPLREGRAVATAGPVSDGLHGSVSDQAAFLCDYAAFLPHGDAPSTLPGMNTAYLTKELRSAVAEAGSSTFWEGPVHRALAQLGALQYVPSAGIEHHKAFPFKLGAQQRFAQGRHHTSWQDSRGVTRLTRLAGTGALPFLLTVRTVRHVLHRGGAQRMPWRGLPHILLLHLAGSAGEAAGLVAGPGDALQEIV